MITSQGEKAKQLMHVRWRHQKTNTASVAAVLRWWVAVHAPADSDEHHVRSLEGARPLFRGPPDALLPGWHEWESNYAFENYVGTPDWRATGFKSKTTLL